MLSLPDELIPDISFYLSLLDIYNLTRSCKKFVNSFNIDWNQYFRYHLNIDFKLNKADIINYSSFFIKKLNHYQFLKFIISNDVWCSSSNNDHYQKEIAAIKINLDKILIIIDKMIDEYKDNLLYNKLIKGQKPVFLHRSDFIGKYAGNTSYKTKRVLTKHLEKIVVIEHNELYTDDVFGREALDMILKFSADHYNKILIILI